MNYLSEAPSLLRQRFAYLDEDRESFVQSPLQLGLASGGRTGRILPSRFEFVEMLLRSFRHFSLSAVTILINTYDWKGIDRSSIDHKDSETKSETRFRLS